ncbi:Hypothetical predicted protein [Marmota monax]|uniref:Uncharacterized protein n=1 Tax=Marmota monax TaxID=9995 RepID=A0A5E4CY16_MARMO|nr:Hypothetical predicted protein [Marmota monax]
MGGYLTRCLKSHPRRPWTAPRPGCAREPGSASRRAVSRRLDPGLFHPALVFPGFFVLSRALPRIGPADLPAAQPTEPKQSLWEILKQGRSAPRPGHTKPPGSRRRPGAHSRVTVVIKAPRRPGTRYKGPPVEPTPDPCAKATVLQALSKCTKGKRKCDGPLWFEMLEPEVPEPKVPKLEVPEPPKSPEPPKTLEPRPSALVPVISKGATPPFAPQLGPATGINGPVPRRPPQSLPPRRPSPVGAGCVPWCRHCTGQGHRLVAADPGAGAPQSRGLGPGRPAQQPQQRTPPEPRRPLSPMVPLTAPRGPNGPIFFRYRPTVIIVSY